MRTMRTKRATTANLTLVQDVHSGVAVWRHPLTGDCHHAEDLDMRGPSIPFQDWERGMDVPHPWSKPFTPRQRVVVNESYAALACHGCGRITGCTCATPPAGGLDAVVAWQRAQGRMR